MHTRLRSVLAGFHRAVREFPDNAALETADTVVSYRDLDKLSGDFAAELAERTVAGEFVGIGARRDLGAVVAMVGALKARHPFVVLDSRDSVSSNTEKVRLLGLRLLAGAGPGGHVTLTPVPQQWLPADAAPAGEDHPLRHPAVGGDAGYAIFTSGSTGKPKCVVVGAAALAPVIDDHVERLSVDPGSRTLQFARLTFDGCLTEILWTLTAGACLVILDETHLAPGAVLRDTLERFRITHLKTTPFALTVTEPSAEMRLRHVVNGGGPCRPSVLRAWSAVADFHNAYGLTETTVCNLLSDPLDPDECRDAVPLGDVVGDCGYWIRDLETDDALEAVPGGAPQRGELVVTGASVAAGFVTEHGVRPLGKAGEYRTGDMVEYRDGALYFVERLDRQVKVRGYRLDPGEIENAVCRLGTVRDAVVVAEAQDGDGSGDLEVLVCYYQGDIAPRSVRHHLEGVLDPYKIPSVLERVEAFPYTPNGKVDRGALRAGRRDLATRAAPAAPDLRVLHLVRTLTGLDDIGLEDNFFDVGGNSASAVALVAEMRKLGWIDAGIRDVLRAENLRVLADQLRERSV